MAVRETAPHLAAGFAERSRAFVEVQNGCDHRCTFCIIPYGRGNSRSVPAGLVVERIKALVDEGFREVVLTGVDVTSYGPDLPGAPTLGQLIERILRHVPDLPRLRLSSLDCIEMDERLFDLATGEPRFMPHLHMSFQAGDDMVLKRMKRRHSRADAVETVARLKAKRPEIAIGADLIAGFPTETDAMAENSLRLIDECDIVMGHIFPFSPKRGTPAARMPQVPPADRQGSAPARLREACAAQKAAWLQGLVGTRSGCWSSAGRRRPCREFRAGPSPSFQRKLDPTASRQRIPAFAGMTGEIVKSDHGRRERHADRSARVSETSWYERMRLGFQQDLRPARRQSHRAADQVGARRGDARRDRGGAGRLRPRARRPPPRCARGSPRSGSSAA